SFILATPLPLCCPRGKPRHCHYAVLGASHATATMLSSGQANYMSTGSICSLSRTIHF
ncbi:hypothetical protein Bpfe_009435, partial [Biomphalaria pfeifferi]